jgi:hypothetical protein
MDEPSKMMALGHEELRERLLNKRLDASVRVPCAYGPCGRMFIPEGRANKYCCPDHKAKARALRGKPVLEERICAYPKCGAKFIPKHRPDQRYHSPECRKRAWFDRNFAPIAKP